jgi:hypothetical protein
MVNCVQVDTIFFLADQIEISRGPDIKLENFEN